ncbi:MULTISPECIES: accessory Sec system protein Asp3 [unclassified Staphylococcus]|uniref:accessory Sec system protein Asp3 n=1 Tax=unclassified Staphylococcus TaxID=91994 RepID=UPI0021CEEDCE|nr:MULTISPECIES: accessory Sec system protein Asp3 [unclassified Staphylococcus]UXR78486.1 accessory Sec system protein Asp3 [Staphylococcus sp. IVB6227]UXR82644.1 accessory Sec system protein Asp3 [Staphylococcus sp. IVB6214]
MQNKSHVIRWTEITSDTFMYGTRLTFHENETVFENERMPSGVIMHTWKMITDYTAEKMVPQLPILKHGKTYRFRFDYDVIPEGHLYAKMIFKRRNGSELEPVIIKSKEIVVTYPTEAFTYELQLINAAATRVHFRSIEVSAYDENDGDKPELYISRIYQESGHSTVMNVIFQESDGLSRDVIAGWDNVILIEHWDLDVRDTIVYCLRPLQQGYHLNFIGYDQQSNRMAYDLAAAMGETAWVTESVSEKVATVEVRQYGRTTVFDFPMSIVTPLLQPSHQLQYLDMEQLNGGTYDETTDG